MTVHICEPIKEARHDSHMLNVDSHLHHCSRCQDVTCHINNRSRKAVQESITKVCLLQIQQVKLAWNAKSKVGSLENATHKPGGGDKKIESVKLDFKEKAKPKIGSKDNVKYQPGGGAVKVCILRVGSKKLCQTFPLTLNSAAD